jgi:mono/diheme cytochrome c family protein
VAERARAWLAANCASCHQPGGPTPTALDLRFDTALGATGMLEAPSSGSLGIADARIVDPGSPATSVLLERIRRLDDTRMPPLSSHVVDETGVTLVAAWIEGL